MRLKGKIVIVTGGGTGIGRAIALRFGTEGATVLVNGRREPPLRAVAEVIRAAGGRAEAAAADVTSAADVERLIVAAVDRHGRLDVLVNNAGVMVSRTVAGECSDEDWQRTLDANLTSVFRCSKAALPALTDSHGTIVNIASVAGAKGSPSLTAYGVAKAGVINLTKTMALDYAPRGIRVNAVCPAYVETDINREYLATLRATGRFEGLLAKHPLGLGRPDDVAWAALYLASDEARWVTGVALPVDGGLLAGL
ncbi:MAG TPA: glucose 1-dehydrogenase [Methylomirabilota bacterium]|nr:glucose 1-dehydrogenase [Methylomirabilota bacterium]